MRYLMMTLTMIATTALVACGKKNDSVANPDLFVNGCAPGYYSYNGTCAVVPGGQQFAIASAARSGGMLTVSNSEAFARLLGQYGRFCVNNGWNNWPGQFNYNIAIGSYNCRSYSQAGYLKIYYDATGTRAQVIVGAGSNNGASPFEVVFNSRIYPVNNSLGMEIRGNGLTQSGGWNAVYDQGLVIIAQNGTINTPNFTAQVMYRGQVIGTAEIYRY